MNKNVNWTVVFSLLASSSFAGGLAFKSIVKYSPIFGSILGFIFITTALLVAIKRYSKFTKY
ncbi:hypothetical protein [Neobacillus sp. Marseille-QA0830]